MVEKEDWKIVLDDAKDSIDSAELLFQGSKFGNAAFLAQQAVEKTIKAYAIRFDLLNEKTQKNLFKTHLPSKILLKDLISDLLESLNKTNVREMDLLVSQLVDSSFKKLDKTKRIMKKVDGDKKLTIELWKFSLGITSEESRITQFFDEIKEFQEQKIPIEMFESTIGRIREVVIGLNETLRKERKSHLIETIKKFVLKQGKEHGIPENITNIIFTEDKGKNLHKIVLDNLDYMKTFDIIDALYGKDGLFDFLNQIADQSENLMKKNEKEITPRMFYLSFLSNIVLLTYPHEEIGRYSEPIDGKTTDEWYLEKKDELKKLIEESRIAFDKTEKIITNS